MAKAKKKLLPKDFVELLEKGDLDELKAVFDTCDLHARGGYSKKTALAFDECPDALARWLVAQGADLAAADTRGDTPLQSRAGWWNGSIKVLLELGADVNFKNAYGQTPLHAAALRRNVPNARLLIEHGAQVDARDNEGRTPLELALQMCSNIDLDTIVPLAEYLLSAGAKKTRAMLDFVETIGQRFEFHRNGFNPDSVEEFSAALDQLYALFDAKPVPRRQLHDSSKPIVVKATTWQKQHEELWKLLVPSQGHAATVQGELVRIAGRISNELEGNGGVNWDRDFKLMADAFLEHVQNGTPLTASELTEAGELVAAIKSRSGDTNRMAELAVKWVLLNRQPVLMTPPAYKR